MKTEPDYNYGLKPLIQRIADRQEWWDSKGKRGLKPDPLDMHMDLCAVVCLVRRLESEKAEIE